MHELVLQDFEPFFPDNEKAVAAFAIFDIDGNGDITRLEFRNTIIAIYRSSDSLEASMSQSRQAIDKLNSIMMVFLQFLFSNIPGDRLCYLDLCGVIHL